MVVLFPLVAWFLGEAARYSMLSRLVGLWFGRGVRGLAADAGYGPGVFLYRDSSIAPLLNLRRRFKAVMDVLGANIRCGVSLARSVELSVQWERILAVGPLYPVTFDDLNIARGLGLGDFHRVASDAHRRLNDFIHQVVFHRRDEAIRGWRNWIRRTFWCIPLSGSGLIWFPPAPFLQCDPHLTPGGSGVLADQARIDEDIRRAWLPYFCRSGQREASLEEFVVEVDGWLPLLPEVHLPRLTGQMLADVVWRKGATASSLDGWEVEGVEGLTCFLV